MTKVIEIHGAQLTTGLSGSTTNAVAPPGIQEGELIVALFAIRSSAAITPPAGFDTALDYSLSSARSAIFYKWATGSEPSSYTFGSGSGHRAVQILRIGGDINPLNPIGQMRQNAGSGATLTHTVQGAQPGAFCLFVVTKFDNSIDVSFPLTFGETILFDHSPATSFRGFGASSVADANGLASFSIVHPPGSSGNATYCVGVGVEIQFDMTRNISAHSGGLWRTVDEVYVRDGGIWKPLGQATVRDSGVWKEIYG